MGGTGVALGVDGATPFLNPATMVHIEDHSIAFTSKFFRYSQRKIEDYHAPGPAGAGGPGGLRPEGTDVTERILVSVPDTTCYFIDVGRHAGKRRALRAVQGSHKLAFCIGKTEETSFSMDAVRFAGEAEGRRITQTQTVRRDWDRWSVGPSWSFAITNELTAGLSLHVVRTGYKSLVSLAGAVEEMGTGQAASSSYHASMAGQSWDALGHIGLTYRLSDIFSLGLSLRTPSVHIAHALSAGYQEVSTDGKARYWAGEGSFVARSPLRVAAGLGAEWSRVRVELNAFLYTGEDEFARAVVDREEVQVSAGAVTLRTQNRLTLVEAASPVANVGFGAEIFLKRDFSLVGGLLTDFSALSARPHGVSAGSRLFDDRMSALYGALGVVSYTDYGDLAFGTRIDYGWGQMSSVNTLVSPSRIEPVGATDFGVMLILAGRLSLRTVFEAARDLGDVVENGADVPPMKKPREPMRTPRRKD